MKTTLSTLALALLLIVLPTELRAQDEFMCMHQEKSTIDPMDNDVVHQLDTQTENNLGALLIGSEQNSLLYRLPKGCEIASILVLGSTGEVFASCPISVTTGNTLGESAIRTSDLPVGKYYIKLLADYAVIDTKQFIKVQ